MALNIQVLSDNRLFPTVFNIVQGSNNVDTVVYTMENYIVGERDLSTYDWYVHLIGVDGVDAVKLTSAIVDGKLQITFDLTEYVTQLGNTLTYQLVAKDDTSAVWNSAKGVILNAESINADDKIVADYASILRQWELRLEEIAGSLDTAIYYIPYGEDLPKEERVVGRLYFKYLYAENKNGQLEDSNGNILIPELVAKNIGITAIDGLTARTVQEALVALKELIENKDSLPAQSGNAGKYLKTNGEEAEWAEVVALPEQEGQSGKFLMTNGADASWSDIPRGLPLLSSNWSDHLLNDASYLRADTFSWQSGDVYKAVYEHLAADVENPVKHSVQLYAWGDSLLPAYTTSATPVEGDIVYRRESIGSENINAVDTVIGVVDSKLATETGLSYNRLASADTTGEIAERADTIGDITITYYLAQDGHKICLPDQEANVMALYEKTGMADYYLLDTTNKQFKLPRKQKRTLIQAVKNTDGTWYNLYSDGWVEQGGQINSSVATNAGKVITLPVVMSDANYCAFSNTSYAGNDTPNYGNVVKTKTATSITVGHLVNNTTNWQVSGMAAESAYASAGMRLEYYYVGNYIRGIDEVNVGAWAELANGVDIAKLTEEVNEVKEAALAEIESAGEATANFQQPLVTLSATSDTVSLEINKIYSMAIDGDLTFELPASVNTSFFNQIKVMAQITGTPVITWGTTYFVNKEEPAIEEGHYDFYFDYDNNLGGWVLGAVTKG